MRTLLDSTYEELVHPGKYPADSVRWKVWAQVRELASELGISRTLQDPTQPKGIHRSKTIAELWPEIRQKIEEELYP